jgi:hypothetical protein
MSLSNSNNLIKTANKTLKYSEQDIVDLRLCSDLDTGHKYFLKNFFYIQHPTRGQIQYEAYEYQDRLVDSLHEYRFNVNMLPRQSGKTTTAVGYLLWYAMFNPNVTILIAAHKYTGAQEIMQRLRYAYETCPNHIRCGVKSYNKQSIEFDNDSRIVAQTTTENTGRGMSISLLYCDEFAFVPDNIGKEFWTSISPTLATGGKAIITSTPNSDEDQFAEIWFGAIKTEDEFGNQKEDNLGVNGFHAYTSHWSDHPDRDDAWADVERGRIGEERFRREYGCEFLVYDETLINSIHLATMVGSEPTMKMGQARWYKKIDPKATYILSLDPALGTGGNYAAIEVTELPSLIQVGEWHHNLTPVQSQVKILRDMCRFIDDACIEKGVQSTIYYSVENNTLGEGALVAINELGEETFPGMFLSEPIKKGNTRRYRKGYNTTEKAKIATCAKLKHLIETKKMTINSQAFISQLKTYIATGTSFAGKNEEPDDLIASMLVNLRMIMQLQDWDPAVYDTMHDYVNNEMELPLPIYVSTSF